jgi:hypothetical protein
MGPQNRRSPKTKWHLGAGHVAMHIVYYKGEGDGFPQVRAVVNLVNPCLPMVHLCTKVFQLCTNQLVVWFVQARVSDWLLVILPSLISELLHAPLPPKCYEPGSVPNSLLFRCFHLGLTFEFIKELGSTSCSETHIKVHKTYFAMWIFLWSQKPITSTWTHKCWLGWQCFI